MTPQLGSYLPGPASGGGGAVKSVPHKAQRNRSSSKTVALKDGLGGDAHDPGRGFKQVEFALEALGAEVSQVELGVRHLAGAWAPG